MSFRPPRPAPDLVAAATGFDVMRWEAERPFAPARLVEALARPWPGVLRVLGFAWVATRPRVMYRVSRVGSSASIQPVSLWLADLPSTHWPALPVDDRTALEARWHPYWGDRMQDLLVIGPHVDGDAVGDLLVLQRTDRDHRDLSLAAAAAASRCP